MRRAFAVRVRFISAVIVLVAIVLVGRLYQVQIVSGDEYVARADHQYTLPTQELYSRGSIFFEDKEGRLVSAATLKKGYTLVIHPDKLENTAGTLTALESILPIDRDDFIDRAAKVDDPYEEILHKLTDEEKDSVEALELPGVSLFKEQWRFYPGSEVAAQTIGFVGFQGDELRGRYGLERYYNDVLSRDEGSVYVNFFAEVFSNVRDIFGETEAAGDIVTSIEPSVQLFLEQELESISDTWNSKVTGGIIIHPQTGNIYALGVNPAFDPNSFGSVENPQVFGNPLIESVYEMGSIMKPITMAIGLDTDSISPKTTYYDAGFIEIEDYTISNFDGKGRGYVEMQEVLNQSLNTGAAFIVDKTGTDTFSKYLLDLGIGEETGIDLPGEVAGIVNNLESPRFIEYATASFGQGIAQTPIATVRALTALANDGTPVTPHVASRITYDSGIHKEISFADEKQIFKKETAEAVTKMLVEVVDEALADGTVALPRYSIAAKTGTAQIAKVGERGYYDDRFLHSFFGYFPAYDPEFLIFLYTVEPVGVRYASQTLTNPFMDIVHFLINYYDVPPDR